MRASFGLSVLCGLLACTVLASGLTGCTSVPDKPPPEITYREAMVPVSVGCVVSRPAPVPALSVRVEPSIWATLAPGAKAQAIAAQAGERMNYEDSLRASTSGCRDTEGG